MTTSIVDRNTFFGAYAPAQEIPFQDGNTIDLSKPPIIAVDSYYERHAPYTEIEAALIKEASQADCKIAIGTIGLERKIQKEIGHLLVYYATEKKVIYIDCQAFDGETLEGDPIIETTLRKEFYFDGDINPNRRSKEDCFCPRVFYTPMNHARPLEYDATTESSNSSSNTASTPTYGSLS